MTDALGNEILLHAPAERIVSLAPNVTEIIYFAGAGQKLVAVSAYSDWPLAARELPRVGDAFRVDLERVVALAPDLVIVDASSTPSVVRDALRRLGIPLLLLSPHKLDDVAEAVKLVGKAAGTQAVAHRVAEAFSRVRKRLMQAHENSEPVSVLYEISGKPLYTIGGSQIISRVIRLCGGRNIFAGLGKLAPIVSRAAVLARNPQVILTGSGPRAQLRLNAWKRWPWLAAVKADNLFILPNAVLGRASPRILLGAVAVCRNLEKARRRL
ncbi:MAG: cobalamin-binding protein [Gammaproteobacteria bacterium]|nr:cobalamin-binding protein [Gammaproteobacteria bacterium]